jgi:hypothetical protein
VYFECMGTSSGVRITPLLSTDISVNVGTTSQWTNLE